MMYKAKIKGELIKIKVKINLENQVVLRVNIIHLRKTLNLS